MRTTPYTVYVNIQNSKNLPNRFKNVYGLSELSERGALSIITCCSCVLICSYGDILSWRNIKYTIDLVPPGKRE